MGSSSQSAIIPHPGHFPAWECMKAAATAQDILYQAEKNLFHPLMHIKIIQKFNGKVSEFFSFSLLDHSAG